MNIAKLVSLAIKSVPTGIRGTVTITRTIRGVLNAPTGVRADSSASFTARCVVVPPKREWVDGAFRQPAYEKSVLVAAADCGFVPEIGMRATIGTLEVWRIVGRTPLNPSGKEDVFYELELGK